MFHGKLVSLESLPKSPGQLPLLGASGVPPILFHRIISFSSIIGNSLFPQLNRKVRALEGGLGRPAVSLWSQATLRPPRVIQGVGRGTQFHHLGPEADHSTSSPKEPMWR